MILNATASDAAVWACMNIGTMGQIRSTRATSEKRTGSNFSTLAEVWDTLELPLSGGVVQL
jgi:hypothetical protein